MCVSKAMVYFLLVTLATTKVRCFEQNDTDSSQVSCETYASKLIEMESAMKKDRDTINQQLLYQKSLSEELLVAIRLLSQAISKNLTTLQTQSDRAEQLDTVKHDQMRKEIETLASKEDLAWFRTKSGLYLQSIAARSCKQVQSERPGKYFIQPAVDAEPFLGYCAQTAFGGGWLVIQHRYDGSVDFRRNWTEYRDGFGSIGAEFWVGLEHLHRMTSARPHELLVELEYFSGKYAYARYSKFVIDSEADHYAIGSGGSSLSEALGVMVDGAPSPNPEISKDRELRLPSGTAADAVRLRQGMKFSTIDRNHDGSADYNCASDVQAAWWYRECYDSNINGIYRVDRDESGLYYTRMLIRET
ncbi:ficolin-1-like [Anopheles merus]|uniref:ficolin-1-like n=1 Tax=Anopheles merus TaxID=30066 RepID=UPI001BE46C3A|nr:ficolin-1-like [Anopheles merus]